MKLRINIRELQGRRKFGRIGVPGKRRSTTKERTRFELEPLEARTLLNAAPVPVEVMVNAPIAAEGQVIEQAAIPGTQAVAGSSPPSISGNQPSAPTSSVPADTHASSITPWRGLSESQDQASQDTSIPVLLLLSMNMATAGQIPPQPTTQSTLSLDGSASTETVPATLVHEPTSSIEPLVVPTSTEQESSPSSLSSMTTEQTLLKSTIATNVRYVSLSGSDANSGSQAQPYRTIKKAVDMARAGDTIYVTNGTYTEGPIVFRRSGEPGKPITLSAAPGHSPVIRWASKTVGDNSIIISAPAGMHRGWITIQGLELTNGFRGVRVHNAHDIVLRDNIIHGNYNNGIQGSGIRVTVDGNTLYNNGRDGTHGYGLYTSGRSWTITNNVIYSNHRGGVQMASFSPTTAGYSSPDYAVSNGWIVTNNIFAWNRNGFGLVIWGSGSANSRVEKNIFYENALTWRSYEPQGIWFMSPGAGHVLKSNVFYATAPGGTRPIGGTPGNWYTETGRIEANPLFVNAGATPIASPNFSLRAGSPAAF